MGHKKFSFCNTPVKKCKICEIAADSDHYYYFYYFYYYCCCCSCCYHHYHYYYYLFEFGLNTKIYTTYKSENK